MVRFTAVLGFIGFLQFLALIGQGFASGFKAKRLSQSIDLTRKIADRQGSDTRQMIETEGFTLNTIKYIADRGLRPYIAFDLSSIILNIDPPIVSNVCKKSGPYTRLRTTDKWGNKS